MSWPEAVAHPSHVLTPLDRDHTETPDQGHAGADNTQTNTTISVLHTPVRLREDSVVFCLETYLDLRCDCFEKLHSPRHLPGLTAAIALRLSLRHLLEVVLVAR